MDFKKSLKIIIPILLIIIFSIYLVLSADLQQNKRITPHDNYGYNSTDNSFTDKDGLNFKANNNGIVTVRRNGRVLGNFGFGMTATFQGNNYNYTSEDFTWTWSIRQNVNNYTFMAVNNQTNFNWTQYFDFSPETSVKIKHVITNNLGAPITNGKFWYIHTIDNGVIVSYNLINYTLGNNSVHLQGNFNSILPQVNISDYYAFKFDDIITNNFTISDIYVGNGSLVQHPETLILAIGVTKGIGTLPNGASVTIDPVIQATGAPDLPDSARTIIVRNSTNSLYVYYSKDPSSLVAISNNAGATWTDSATAIDCDFGAGPEGTMLINSSDSLFLFCADASYLNMTISNNGGLTWISKTISSVKFQAINSINSAVDINDNIVLCLNDKTNTIQIWNSTTSGMTWTNTNITNADANDQCDVEADSTGRWHLALFETTNFATDDVAYYTTTNPTSWGSVITVEMGTTRDNDIGQIIIDPRDNEVFIMAIKDSNVDGNASAVTIFNSTDNGVSWSTVNVALDATNTLTSYDFIMDKSGNIHIIADAGTIIRYVNSTNGGISYSQPFTLVSNAGGLTLPTLRGSQYPVFNQVDGVLEYVWINSTASDIYFGNLSIPLSNTAPTFTINKPLNDTTWNIVNITVNVTIQDINNDSNMRVITWLNQTLSNLNDLDSCGCQNNITILNTNQTTNFNFTNLSDGRWYWNMKADDGTVNSTLGIQTFVISTTNPAVTLDYPNANQFFNTKNITMFNATASDTDGIRNLTLYHNINGTFVVNASNFTVVTSGKTNNITAISNIPDGSYIWDVKAYDGAGNSNFAGNRTFTIDTINPFLTLTQPTGTKSVRTGISINWNVSDVNLNICWYNRTFSTGELVGSVFNSVTCTTNVSTTSVAIDGDYILYFFVNDSANNINSTSINFTVDTSVAPSPAGGGGGALVKETIIQPGVGLVCPQLGWIAKTRSGTDKYSLFISENSKRTAPIVFINNGTKIVNISTQCIGFDCDKVKINPNNVSLLPNSNIPIIMEVEITADNNTKYGDDIEFSVILNDNEECEGSISFIVKVRYYGLFYKTTSIGSVNFPTWLLALPVGLLLAIFIGFLLRLTKLKNEWRAGIAAFLGIVTFPLLLLIL